ncbi:hypothetical protein [Desulforhopalus singaporensis]|uniref:Uncharacterized protein n=1 Tax=Desulforhopalus singaporensis TaxID=91360 RepID=A0A1H0T0W1_9BACT|nr:hypothetical protein [Desulforhopalus singaporensis]SDP47584.1 hypothetical protein SAMN05660330_02895 [Desulforhopalus singaporensis]
MTKDILVLLDLAVNLVLGVFFLHTAIVNALTELVLFRPEKSLKGIVDLTYKDSRSVKPSPNLPQNGTENPSSIFFRHDELRCGQMDSSGCGIQTPDPDRLADSGWNLPKIPPLGLPTRAALLSQRNHHNAEFLVIAEPGTSFWSCNSSILTVKKHCGDSETYTKMLQHFQEKITICQPVRTVQQVRWPVVYGVVTQLVL